MFFFDCLRLLLYLVRPLWRPMNNYCKLQLFIKKISLFFSCKFFQFLVIKTLDSKLYPDPQLGKMLDPYADPH
jgi:hypothetical protein